MTYTLFVTVTIMVLLIISYQWRDLTEGKPRDKAVFVVLLLAVWLLSMLDLPYTPGPTTWIAAIFKSFEGIVKLP